jgi:hypothetical protein
MAFRLEILARLSSKTQVWALLVTPRAGSNDFRTDVRDDAGSVDPRRRCGRQINSHRLPLAVHRLPLMRAY